MDVLEYPPEQQGVTSPMIQSQGCGHHIFILFFIYLCRSLLTYGPVRNVPRPGTGPRPGGWGPLF